MSDVRQRPTTMIPLIESLPLVSSEELSEFEKRARIGHLGSESGKV